MMWGTFPTCRTGDVWQVARLSLDDLGTLATCPTSFAADGDVRETRNMLHDQQTQLTGNGIHGLTGSIRLTPLAGEARLIEVERGRVGVGGVVTRVAGLVTSVKPPTEGLPHRLTPAVSRICGVGDPRRASHGLLDRPCRRNLTSALSELNFGISASPRFPPEKPDASACRLISQILYLSFSDFGDVSVWRSRSVAPEYKVPSYRLRTFKA